MLSLRHIALFALFFPLMACTSEEMYQGPLVKDAQVTDRTRAGAILEKLPPAKQKVAVSLYDFQDMTGQFKFNGNYSDFSSAVTKGGLSILMKALLDSGNKKWFTVTERSGLKNLLQERQIIKVMRGEYTTPNGEKLPELPPLLYGGMLLEGGIIGYDSNVITGGAGAIYLGIGGNTRYARDVITVYLRAVNIQTGEVMLSVTSSKTIFSTAVNANVLKYITFDKLLQAEAGFSLNEPVMLATRQAIETAVYSLIMEGAMEGMWEFGDPKAGQKAIAEYKARRDTQNVLPSTQEDRIFERAMMGEEAHDAGAQHMAAIAPAAAAPEDRQQPTYAAAVTMPVEQSGIPAPQQAATAPLGVKAAPSATAVSTQASRPASYQPGTTQTSSWGTLSSPPTAPARSVPVASPVRTQQDAVPHYAQAQPLPSATAPPRQRIKENYYHLVY